MPSLRVFTAGQAPVVALLLGMLGLLGGCHAGDEAPRPAEAGAPVDGAPPPAADHAREQPPDAGACTNHPSRTVGLIACSDRASPGYTLFSPLGSTSVYLIDLEGRLVHAWSTGLYPGMSAELLESGNLLRAAFVPSQGFDGAGGGGRIQELTWDGQVIWDFLYATDHHLQHHDLARLPNGNVVLVAWEKKSEGEAVAAGRDPSLHAELWVDHLVEIKPTGPTSGAIVWEWHLWDHLVQDRDPTKANFGLVADHPELVDINSGPPQVDWTHTNAVAYNAQLDQLVISVHGLDELLVIDHGTTTQEAAGHTGGKRGRGGDILYRWGNPANYGAGSAAKQVFSGQHDAHWIAPGLPGAGDLLVFNNGGGWSSEASYSTVDQLTPPLTAGGTYALSPGAAYGPLLPTWRYASPSSGTMVAYRLSSAQRLPGGNTLICVGTSGTFLEVTPAGEVVWTYINPVSSAGILQQGANATENDVFRARRYPPSYPGLAGRDLTPVGTIELP